MNDNDYAFLKGVARYIERRPEVGAYVSDFVAKGIDAARKEAMNRAADFEVALSFALAKRNRKQNDKWIYEKLLKWGGKSALRWDCVIDGLAADIASGKEPEKKP